MPAYTPIIVPADLNNIIYPEIISEITRNDGGAIATQAIAIAIGEVKIYLARFDLVQLFGDPTPTMANPEGIAATFSDAFLTQLVKYTALWHLIQLANPNINYDSAKLLYDQAHNTLKNIGDDQLDPQWPLQDNSPNIVSFQFPKRHNGY